MNTKNILSFLLMMICFIQINAQTDFHTFYSPNYAVDLTSDVGYKMHKISDGFITAGTKLEDNNNSILFLAKFNNCMNEVWNKTYGVGQTIYNDHHDLIGLSLIVTHTAGIEDGFAFSVTQHGTGSCCIDNAQIYICKTDLNGNILWDKVLETDEVDLTKQIIQAANGDLVLLGTTNESGDNDVFVSRYNSVTGALIWNYRYDNDSKEDIGYSIIETVNNKLIIVGETEVTIDNTNAFYLILESYGWVISSKEYESFNAFNQPQYEGFLYINNAGNNEYYLSGHIENKFEGNGDGNLDNKLLLVKIDYSGNIIWDRQYGVVNPNPDYRSGIVPLYGTTNNNNNLVLAGTFLGGGGLEGFFAAKFNPDGDVLWTKGDIYYDNESSLNSIEYYDNNKLVATGRLMDIYPNDPYTFIVPIFRIDDNGNNCYLEDKAIVEEKVGEDILNRIPSTFDSEIPSMTTPAFSTLNTPYTYDMTKRCGEPDFDIDLGTDVIVCYAANYFIQAPYNASYQYDWLQPPPANCTPSTGNIFNACNSGEYCVNVTNGYGCSASDCINIQFDNFPVVLNVAGTPDEICPGDPVSLFTSTPCIGCNFSWSPGGETTSSISVSPIVTTTYTLTASNSHGCHSSGSVTITVSRDCDLSFCRIIDDELPSSAKPNVGRAIASSSDGGIVIAGDMYQSFSDADIYFAKYNPYFSQENEYIIGDYTSGGQTTNVSESGFSVIEGPGGFFVAGFTPMGSGNSDVVVTKYDLNNSHHPLWCYRYNFGGDDVARKIIDISTAQERRLMIIGYSNAYPAPNGTLDYDMFAMIINESGTSPIVYFYGKKGKNEYAYDALRLRDQSGYVLAGDYRASSSSDMMVVKLNNDFTYANDRIIIGNGYDAGRNISEFDGRLYVSGYSNSFSTTYDVIISELSIDLNTIYDNKIFGASNADEYANDMIVGNDGFLYLAGTLVRGTNSTYGFLLKVKPTGLTYGWTKITDVHSPYANFFGLTQINDGSIVLIGNYETSENFKEIFLVKTLRNHESCCLKEFIMVRNLATPSSNKQCSRFIGLTIPVVYGNKKEQGLELPICPNGHVARETNTNSEAQNNSLVISPNPNNGLFTIQLVENSFVTEINLYDLSGRRLKTIYSPRQSSGQLQINASNLTNGIYFIEATTATGKYKSKISIQK